MAPDVLLRRRVILMPRVGIVEDNHDIAQLLRLLLDTGEHELRCFDDGVQFFESFQRGDFDLVLLDIALPLLSGYDILERLRQEDPDLPVIAITAHASSGDEQRAYEAGFCSYFRKPILVDDVTFRTLVFQHFRGSKVRKISA